ncbi:MAG: hypothetical protein D6735_08450 [Acidobacteria bacterium]|nr:MAG: hypothetical protein D6735_08450 [Acidobacteriota bacterium]
MQNSGKTSIGLDANIAAMLCYIPLCCINLIFSIILVVTEKTNKFARFHAFQSILLSVLLFVISFLLGFIQGALNALDMHFVGFILSGAQIIIGFGFLAVYIIACIKAYQNEIWKLPVIGDMAEKWA